MEKSNDRIIYEGQIAVSSLLNRCSEQPCVIFMASKYDLMVLLYHYCKKHVEAYDLAVFYGQRGGEWKRQMWANHAIERIEHYLGSEAVEQMFEAAEQEWDARNRQRLAPDDLALYENRHECPELFVERMYQRSDERMKSTKS